jgi:PAB-dependent poly(A)-specific ribonuclease subunit 3
VINEYHSLVPIGQKDVTNNSISSRSRLGIVKGVSFVDGKEYVIRQIQHIYPSPEVSAKAKEVVNNWSSLVNHPNIAAIRASFVSADNGVPALYLSYDYHVTAVSLKSLHCSNEGCKAATEPQLWSYATQLCSVLRSIHRCGLSAGGAVSLKPSKILLCCDGQSNHDSGVVVRQRLRIAAVGLVDALYPNKNRTADTSTSQRRRRDDLIAVGQLLAVLACGPSQVTSSDVIALAQKFCSKALGQVISDLAFGHISDSKMLSQLLAPAAFDALHAERIINDQFRVEFVKEVENGRLLRILTKLAFVNERPSGRLDTNWAETGDRYILKLFRDYLFHQDNEDGSPILDWGHVFDSLNKVDIGVPEKVILLSRDELSMLVVSYADIKACIAGAYADLIKAS